MNVNTGFLSCGQVKALLAALLLMLVTMLCGCGGGGGPVNIHGDGTSGVRGMAFARPPGQTQVAPLAGATITVQKSDLAGPGTAHVVTYGPVLAQTQTDAQGNYSIALAPGIYSIGGDATQPNGYQTITIGVTVQAKQFATLNLAFNSPPP